MNEREKTMRYEGLDSLKAFCAFLVVCIHAPFSGLFGDYFEDLCCLAVPVFFTISGFFYPRALRQGREKRQIGRIAKMTLVSAAAYFVWMYVFYRWTGQDFSLITDRLFSFRGLFKLVFFNNINFAYHLWYLSAILYVLILLAFCWKKGWMKLLYAASPFLLLAGIAMSKYAMVVFGRFISLDFSRNAWFLGLPFVCLGMYLSENRERIFPKLKKKLLLCGALFFALTSLLEHLLLDRLGLNMEGDVYLSTPPFVLCVFLYCACFARGLPFLSRIGKDYATGIYIVHVAVLDILYTLVSKTSFVTVYDAVAPVFIFPVSLGLGFLGRKLPKLREAKHE